MTGLQFPAGAMMGFYLFATASKLALQPTQLPIQCVTAALYPEVKWLEREAHHSPPSSDENKNEWSYTSTPQCVFKAWHLNTGTTPLPLANGGTDHSRAERTIPVAVFWVMIPCSNVAAFCHIYPEDGGSMGLRNVGILPHHYTV
jgi:hypothetical protein